jgi:hypothetical protein
MARKSKHGDIVLEYFADRRGFGRGLVAICSDGTVLHRGVYHGWKVAGRKKADVPYEQWIEGKRKFIETLPWWAKQIKTLPSRRTLEEWMTDSVCESVTGDTVEHDGHGPDGAPSWLLALGMI